MDQKNLFKASSLVCIYTFFKKKNISNKGETIRVFIDGKDIIIFSQLCTDKLYAYISDKEALYHETKELYLCAFEGDTLSEKKFFETLGTLIEGITNHDKHTLYEVVGRIATAAGVISTKENEALAQVAHSLGLKEIKAEKSQGHEKGPSTKRTNWMPITIGCLMVCAAGFLLAYSFYWSPGKRKLNQLKLSNIIYQKISFDKFIVASNRYSQKPGGGGKAEEYLSKAVVLYVKGHADVEFDFKSFRLVKDRLVYSGEKIEGMEEVLPFKINVQTSQKDQHTVYEIEPKPVSESNAGEIAKPVGIVAGSLGGFYCGKAGSKAASTFSYIFPLVKTPVLGKMGTNIIGSVTGATVGAVATGATGYIATKKFLTDLQLTPEINGEDLVRILEKAKELIAAELFFDEHMQKDLKESFENYARSFFRDFGVELNEFIYKVN